MLKTDSLSIWGDVSRSEFVSVYRRILDLVPDSVAKYSGAVLFQSYPGEFSQAVVDRFIIAEPLSPVLVFLGSASEGEMRTGHPLAGCFRFYVHQWNEEYQHQWFLYRSGKPSFFTLPRTLENDEIAMFHAVSASCPANNRKNRILSQRNVRNVLIVQRWGTLGNDSAMNQFLMFFYRQQGFKTDFLNRNTMTSSVSSSFCGMIIADADDSPFSEILESVQRLRQNFADSTITVYINSPRINERIDLQNAGANEIISKPVFW
jgi:hypothetical protein